MPELPEVELCALKLRAWCVGRRVLAVYAEAGPPLRGDTTPARLVEALVGHTITRIDRRGKQLLLRTSGPWVLLVHLGMTGEWARTRERSRCVIELDDGPVAMLDVRRLGRVRVVPADRAEQAPEWAELGPDALEIAGKKGRLARCFVGCRAPIKAALLDQGRVAGVGNIYAAEACFEAGVDPRRPADTLDVATYDRLGRAVVAAMRLTLREGKKNPDFAYITAGGENTFRVYGREGQPCPRCRAAIVRFEQGGRSTYACPRCQPRYKARRKV